MSARPPKNLIDWLQISDTPNWSVARPLGVIFAVLLTLLFLSALIAAFSVIWRTGFGAGGDSLGAGTLVVAILSAPFLIWSTVLKHQTLRYQKEGHITDRINKAVEQLGSEKTVKKPSRAAARLCAVETACATLTPKGSCRWLIGGLDPVKKRGIWADAHLRVVTPP